jgi:murein L,D-transpeptidase YcbB/YkuD
MQALEVGALQRVKPHRKHLHLSVMNNASCDDPSPWNLPMFRHLGQLAKPAVTGPRTLRLMVPYMTGDDVAAPQRVLNRWYPANPRLAADGVFGPATEAAVRRFQGRAGFTVDGVAGPATLAALHLT